MGWRISGNSVESSAIDNPASETAILWGKNLPQSIPLIWSFCVKRARIVNFILHG
jgi:hypothetical protein